MPCLTGLEKSTDGGVSIKTRAEISRLKAHVIKLETLLCGSCRALEITDYDFGTNPELDTWWAKHELRDNRRRKKELSKRLAVKRAEWAKEQAILLLDKPLGEMNDDEKAILKEAGVLG